jgi:PAS domain-containing protein
VHDGEFADLVGRIYAAALDEAPWSGVLCAMADLCGAENAALVVVDSRLAYSTVITPRADPDIVSAYAGHWWLHDPTAKATASAPVGHLTTLADTGRELFLQSQFHNDFWRRSGLGTERIATNLLVGDGMFSSLVLQTSVRRDEIDEAMFKRFAFFVPHFVEAINLARRLYRLEIEGALDDLAGTEDCAGIIVVDAAGRVVFADAAADALLIAGDDMRAAGGSLHLAQYDADIQLRDAIAACAASSSISRWSASPNPRAPRLSAR